jgi:two-component system, OmpR family, sensor kinase
MMFTRSIRWRLQLWLAFLLATILSGFGVTACQLYRIKQLNQIDEDLGRRLSALSSGLRPRPPFGSPRGHGPMDREGGRQGFEPEFGQPPPRPPFDDGSPPSRRHSASDSTMPPGPKDFRDFRPETRSITFSASTLSLFDDSESNSFYYAIWSRGGVLLRQSSNAPANLALPPRQRTDAGVRTRMWSSNREAWHFTGLDECVLAGCSIRNELRALRRFAWALVGAGGGLLALGLGGGWLLVSGAIRPIQDISVAARRISEGNLAERINVADTDSELGRLASVLNSSFARLEASFAQQKQFTADASHELRTPIAVIISEAQTVLAQQRKTAEYCESVKICLEAAQQMRKLTQSLLRLARYDSGQEKLERSAFDLAAQTRACVELIRPLAKEQGIHITCDLAPTNITGDPDRLSQVITNLLINAINYNHDAGEVRVTTGSENGLGVLTVQDTGQGIAPQDLPHIFERFYRADKARARARGHCGLGLAICKSIIEAHGGMIQVVSEVGVGSKFTVQLPK